jgi:hypothetical protein
VTAGLRQVLVVTSASSKASAMAYQQFRLVLFHWPVAADESTTLEGGERR